MNGLFFSVKKPGRCWDGFERGTGFVIHALQDPLMPEGSYGKALCGTKPGARTPGWSWMEAIPARGWKVFREVITCGILSLTQLLLGMYHVLSNGEGGLWRERASSLIVSSDGEGH